MAQLELDVEVVKALQHGDIENSYEFAAKLKADHQALIGKLASLSSADVGCVSTVPLKAVLRQLTEEGKLYLQRGLPETLLVAQLKGAAEGLTKEELVDRYPDKTAKQVEAGLKVLMKEKVAGIDKATKKYTLQAGKEAWVSGAEDDLKIISSGTAAPEVLEKTAKSLGSRKLVQTINLTYHKVSKGPNYPDAADISKKGWRVKKAADFTAQDLRAMWETGTLMGMKKPNIAAEGVKPVRGNLHPLMKLRQQYREIFLELGFKEMDTARFVDSSFWNFDTLFVPQQHPARDAQDTFFIKDPASTKNHPEDYIEATAKVHGPGDFGSTGYRYKWSREETEKNVLRTHTTSISSYTLHQIGQEYQRTGKLQTGAYFSIDRVFRNENMDKTHLCEFHQMEGFVLDYGLSLSNMMSLLQTFFLRVGVKNLMFKPAYNPYTEPSMEVHTEQNGKVMEVGNSGVFRPEMLRPMGLPEGVTAIAWGLGLERVAMRHYKLESVQELFGHKVSMPFVSKAAAPRV
eukprot:TRINITY_DN3013_c2_g2_i1.p1 TRINITY_DN3013_c2_g2~~TRINITY_DN3013_c2_g2_i1.p1  ORF type:complete len:516 (+),score=243.39 TRINITY_DN3013_c2_g2_i1:60-1607(+)